MEVIGTPYCANVAYVLVALAVFAANAVPAFAPPTWSILVWFELSFDLRAPALVVLGVLGATTGRALLATYMRHSTRWMPKTYVENMRSAGEAVTAVRGRAIAVLALFLVSPISSAQLFTAAGIMRDVRLRPLLIAFAMGRTISYSIYVTGAHFAKASLGDVLIEGITSPWGVAFQVLMVAGIVALGSRPWTNGRRGNGGSRRNAS